MLEYTVVLASGRTVTANACHYTDLFAALRGGGGGTYGIVTSATIKAYPDRPALGHELTIVALPNRTADLLDVTADIMEHYPRLVDAGWSGNAILTQAAGPFVYTHPLVTLLGPGQNLSSPVAAHARELMEREVISRLLPNNGTSLLISSEFTLFPTFLDWYNTHTHMTDGQRRPMMASRFLDKASLASRDKNRGLLEVILDGQGNRTTTSSVTFFNLVAGGKVMQPQPHTAINPAWRSTYVVAQQIDLWPDDAGYEEIAQVKRELTHKKLAAMKTLAPGMGTYGNEADPYDPDWRHDWWGEDNYNWLVGVKRKYDPDDVFWCWRCVGNDAWGEILGGTLYGPLCETA